MTQPTIITTHRFSLPGRGNREVNLAKEHEIQGRAWGRGFVLSIPSAGGGCFFPRRGVNILCTCRDGTRAISAFSPVQLPLPRLCVLADFLFQTSGPCYMSECIIQISLS